MKFSNLIPLVYACALLNLSGACHQDQESSLSIVRGQQLSPDSPALNNVVGLSVDGKKTFCTGSIVAEDLVVTAAHCVNDQQGFYVVFGQPGNLQKVAVESVETYKPYADAAFPNFDIAWIKLQTKVPEGYQPMEILRDPTKLMKSQEFRIAGYGHEKTNCKEKECNDELLETKTSLQKYHDSPRLMSLLVFKNMMEPGFGASCNGDSGGPAYANIDGKWYLIGVTNGATSYLNPDAFGDPTQRCEQGSDTYTFMGDYAPWIQKSSGQELVHTPNTNPDRTELSYLVKGEVKPVDAPEPKTWAEWIQYPYHNEQAWNTVEYLLMSLLSQRQRRLTPDNFLRLYEDPEFSQLQVEQVTSLVFDRTRTERLRFQNQPQDIRPLASWTSLQALGLGNEAAVDGVEAVAKLPSLRSLTLAAPRGERRQPLNLQALQQYSTSLSSLTLKNYTPAELQTVPFASLKQVSSLSLSALQGKEPAALDLSALSGLTQLQIFDWKNESRIALPKDVELSDLVMNPSHASDLQWLDTASIKSIKNLIIGREVLESPAVMNRFQNKSVRMLVAPHNGLTVEQLPAESFSLMMQADLSGNRIDSTMFLKALPALRSVDLRDNPLVDAECPAGVYCRFDRIVNPKTLADYCRNTVYDPGYTYGPMVEMLLRDQGLESQYYTDATCDALNDSLSQVRALTLEGDLLDYYRSAVAFDVSILRSLNQLTSVRIRNAVLANAGALAELSNLTDLDLGFVKTRRLNFIQKMPQLSNLSFIDFPMTDLEAVSHPGLKTLAVTTTGPQLISEGGKLESIGTKTELPALTKLSVRGNPLRDLQGVEKLKALTLLDISSTKVTDLSPLSALIGTTVLFGDTYKLDTCPILHGSCEVDAKSMGGAMFGADAGNTHNSKWFAGQILPGLSKKIRN